MADDGLLLAVLESLRERGALGESSLTGAVAHAESFVAAVPSEAVALLDLGSGGGLPGLVIAARLTHLRVTLTDRRERRMDLLRRACAQLDFGERVEVCTGDVRQLAQDPGLTQSFDVVTARGFGEPLWTLRCARPFLRLGGVMIVSEPPPRPPEAEAVSVPRWPVDQVCGLGFALDEEVFTQVRRFKRVSVMRGSIDSGQIGT